MASGGITARNTRQGFRSEYIARYVFSAFGTAVEVSQGNDIGLDILCNLTSFKGLLIFYKSSFGVQVKSSEDEFVYKGKQATTWLSKLEYPLLLASINKEKGRIKIYSTWNLNRYLLSFHTDEESIFPDQIKFITSEEDGLKEPDTNGNIPVGKPILDFEFADIDDPEKYEVYYKVIDEWLEIDNNNYSLRRAGVPLTFGYINWETNCGLNASVRVWHKGSFYSSFHSDKIKKLIAQALIPLGLYNRDNFNGSGLEHFKNDFNDLKKFSDKFLSGYMDDWGKGLFDSEL